MEHFCEIILHLDQGCTYDIEGVCGCLIQTRVSFYLALFRLPGNLHMVGRSHTQHIVPQV